MIGSPNAIQNPCSGAKPPGLFAVCLPPRLNSAADPPMCETMRRRIMRRTSFPVKASESPRHARRHNILAAAMGMPMLIAVVFLLLLSGAPARSAPDCKCRYNGKFFEVGERTCIRGRVATCALVLNNSSWSISNKTCSPVAHRQSLRRSVATRSTPPPTVRHSRSEPPD